MAVLTILASLVGLVYSTGNVWALVGHLHLLNEAKLKYEKDLNK